MDVGTVVLKISFFLLSLVFIYDLFYKRHLVKGNKSLNKVIKMQKKFKHLIPIFLLFAVLLWGNNGKCNSAELNNLKRVKKIIAKNASCFPLEYQSFIKQGNFNLKLIKENFFKENSIVMELTVGNENSFVHPVVFPVALIDEKVLIFNKDYSNYELVNKIVDVRKIGENLQKWITLGIYFSPYGIFASPIITDLKFRGGKTEKIIKYLPGELKITGGNFEFNQVYCGLFRDFFKVRIKGSLKKQKITLIEAKEIHFK